MSDKDRARPAGQALAVPAEPASGLIASRVDPSRKCGNCALWGVNFYPPRTPSNTTCCADVVMDLPASFIPSRQTMAADQGGGCICWQPCDSDGSGAAGETGTGSTVGDSAGPKDIAHD